MGDFLPAWKFAEQRPRVHSASDWKQMSEHLGPYFNDVNVSFLNCECTLNTAGLPPRPLNGLGDIVSSYGACLEYLASLRANVIGIANNHAYDYGPAGVERTREAISARGLVALGAGSTLQTLPEVFVWQGPGNIRVGFWAAARATANPSTRTRAGVEPATVQRARQAFHEISQQGAQFSTALLHVGCLRTSYPSPEDLELIDALGNEGFDVVAASHSHRISGAKILLRGKKAPAFCFYGLGSIVSGFVAAPADREGLIVIAALDATGRLARLEVRPVLLDQAGFGAIPDSATTDALLDRFRELSARIADGSYSRRFHAEISPGLVPLYIRDARRAFQQGGARGIGRKLLRIRLRHLRRLAHAVLP